jgi:general stress protein 13
MKELRVGEIIKVQVIGSQHYGIFIKCIDDESYSGLIHISEISNDFVKDVSKVAKVDDILYAKVLDIDHKLKQLKLSIKAINPKVRYKTNFVKIKDDKKYSDFTPLEVRLNNWIIDQLKEKKKHD